MKIEVDLRCDVKASFFTPAQVKRAALKILRALGTKKGALSVWLVGDRKIRTINRKFLNHDYATDVISFGTNQGDSKKGTQPQLSLSNLKYIGEAGTAPTSHRRFLSLQCQSGQYCVPFFGNIVLSIDAIRRQAKEIGHSPRYELYFCLAHGILHLIGCDDKIKSDRERMFRKQKALLKNVWREKQ